MNNDDEENKLNPRNQSDDDLDEIIEKLREKEREDYENRFYDNTLENVYGGNLTTIRRGYHLKSNHDVPQIQMFIDKHRERLFQGDFPEYKRVDGSDKENFDTDKDAQILYENLYAYLDSHRLFNKVFIVTDNDAIKKYIAPKQTIYNGIPIKTDFVITNKKKAEKTFNTVNSIKKAIGCNENAAKVIFKYCVEKNKLTSLWFIMFERGPNYELYQSFLMYGFYVDITYSFNYDLMRKYNNDPISQFLSLSGLTPGKNVFDLSDFSDKFGCHLPEDNKEGHLENELVYLLINKPQKIKNYWLKTIPSMFDGVGTILFCLAIPACIITSFFVMFPVDKAVSFTFGFLLWVFFYLIL